MNNLSDGLQTARTTFNLVRIGLLLLFVLGIWLVGVASGDLLFAASGGAAIVMLCLLAVLMLGYGKRLLGWGLAIALVGMTLSGGVYRVRALNKPDLEARQKDLVAQRAEHLSGLNSPAPMLRKQSAERIGKYRPMTPEAVPELTRLLSDSDPPVREAAGNALVELAPLALSDPEMLETLLGPLAYAIVHTDDVAAEAVWKVFKALGTKAGKVAHTLLEGMPKASPMRKVVLGDAVLHIAPDRTEEAIMEMGPAFTCGDAQTVMRAVHLMGFLGVRAKPASEYLARVVENPPNFNAMTTAARTLMLLNPKKAREVAPVLGAVAREMNRKLGRRLYGTRPLTMDLNEARVKTALKVLETVDQPLDKAREYISYLLLSIDRDLAFEVG